QFSAGQETRRLAAGGEQIRLGQNLQQVSVLQGFNRRAHIRARMEKENIQQVAQADGAATGAALRVLQLRRSELLRRNGAEKVLVRAEPVDAELSQLRPIHLGKTNLQHHLLLPGRRKSNGVHNVLGERRPHLSDLI